MKKKSVILFLQIIIWTAFLWFPSLYTYILSGDILYNSFFLSALSIRIFLIIVFYLNYLLFVPKFFFTRKYFIYALTWIGCIAIIVSASFFLFERLRPGNPKPFSPVATSAPVFSENQAFFGRQDSNIVKTHHSQKDPFFLQRPDTAGFPRPLRSISFWDGLWAGFDNSLLKLMLILFASLGLRVYKRWEQAEKEKLRAQVSFLQAQINPHFLFNTLNSIYAVTVSKTEKGADMIDKLSQMMRYNLKESQFNLVPLEKEINYIENYIALQRVRFDDRVKFSYHAKGNFGENQIAPMLLIPFIENAFKHGVNSEEDSNIKIDLNINNNVLYMYIFNHKVTVRKNKDACSEWHGSGKSDKTGFNGHFYHGV